MFDILAVKKIRQGSLRGWGLSPAQGSVLSMGTAWDSLSPSPSAPPSAHTFSQSKEIKS